MSHLRLISFTTDNFDIGRVLTYADNAEVIENDRVNEALSLYFQWQDRAVIAAKIGKEVVRDAMMSYDRMDLEPEYIWIETSSSQAILPGEPINVYFEVFNTAYSFVAKIDELVTTATGTKLLYIRRPQTLRVAKARQTQRRSILEKKQHLTLVLENNIECTVMVQEIGPRSACVECPDTPLTTTFSVRINGDLVPFRVIRRDGIRSIIELNTSDVARYSIYFRFYASIIYPHLQNKSDTSLDEVIEMYERSGFYGKGAAFDPKDARFQKTKIETLATWKDLASPGCDVIEMVARSDGGELIGSSCLAKAFVHKDQPYWVIHHLAVITDPSSIRRTTDLYLWRIDYLLGLDPNFSVCCWYDSTSKWIDRIWTKFHRTCLSKGAYVHATDTYTFVPVAAKEPQTHSPFKVTIRPFGRRKRAFLESDKWFGGIGPQFLNSSGFLNHICMHETPPTEKELGEICAQVAQLDSHECQSFRMTVPKGTTIESLKDMKKSNADRFCVFPNESLPQLLSSLMHSLAVMERKHEISNHKLA